MIESDLRKKLNSYINDDLNHVGVGDTDAFSCIMLMEFQFRYQPVCLKRSQDLQKRKGAKEDRKGWKERNREREREKERMMQKRKVDGLFVHLNGLIFTRTKYAEIKKNKKRKKGFF